MKRRLLDLICCPMCGGAFRDVPFAARDEIDDGVLACDGCARVYPVIHGVPRLLPDALAHVVPAMHSEFFARHAEAVAPYPRRCSPDEADRAVDAKQRTIASYSYQWRKFREISPTGNRSFGGRSCRSSPPSSADGSGSMPGAGSDARSSTRRRTGQR